MAVHGVVGIAGGDAPWVSSVGVLTAGFSCVNPSVVLLVARVVVPEQMDVFSSAVEELKEDWLIPSGRFDRGLSNFNDSVRISKVRNEDILAIDGAVVWVTTRGHPGVSSISSHTHCLSCSNASVTHLVALVIEPEELNLLVACIVELKGH